MSSLTLLPLQPDELKAGELLACRCVEESGPTPEEALVKLEADFNNWLDHSDPNPPFPDSLVPIMNEASWFFLLLNPREGTAHNLYRTIIHKLTANEILTRRQAAATLSHLPLISQLVSKYHYSSAGIAKILGMRDSRISIHWKVIERIINILGYSSSLNPENVNSLMALDRELSTKTLHDSTLVSAVEELGYVSLNLGLNPSYGEALKNLITPRSGLTFVPYLQALMHIATIAHFYDHPPEYLYTFQPRGAVANSIFAIFPSNLAPSGNPILNNFKAIDKLSFDWSEPRTDNYQQARAFVEIVLGLSSLSHSSRKAMAASIRYLLIRYIDIRTPRDIELPEVLNTSRIFDFVAKVARRETQTGGVIEQRVTDFLASVTHEGGVWRSRGIGDPVNATNTSSKKLGDCDFQNSLNCECIAIESHAGKLTPIYINEHLRTLKRNISARLEEWEHIDDLPHWSLTLLFIVHEDASANYVFDLDNIGVRSSITIKTYAQMLEEIKGNTTILDSVILKFFNTCVIDRINASNTPYATKRKTEDLLKSD